MKSYCVSCLTLLRLQPTRFLCPWDSPGKNTGVGYHSLFQGIFPTQRSNLSFLQCRQILDHLSHQGSPTHIIKLIKMKLTKIKSILCACVWSHFSCVWLFVTLGTVACQAPLSMGFSRQESCSGLPCSPLGDLPNPGTEPTSLMSPVLADGFFTTSATWEAHTPFWDWANLQILMQS